MVDVNNLTIDPEILSIKKTLPRIKISTAEQELISRDAKEFIEKIRQSRGFSVEKFISKFNLSTDEGIAIMCLAESFLRIPDSYIAKKIAIDKLTDKSWGAYVIRNPGSLKSFIASLGLMVSGGYCQAIDNKNIISKALDRIGSTVFLKAMRFTILYLSREFIFAESIYDATDQCKNFSKYQFAFDLLGESSRTKSQADLYFRQYFEAIEHISSSFPSNEDLLLRPNLSVKLTALHPRFELNNFPDLEENLLPEITKLVLKIRDNNLTITFDAEESTRMDCYLMFLTKLLSLKEFENFEGIGLVIQAYQIRSYEMLKQIIELSKKLKKQIPIRLVKGAYWDMEIKHAQVIGMKHYPVYTKKEYTDANYLACARLMLENTDYIYPQFATHNALTASYIKHLGGNKNYEFQKLYGMGDALHTQLLPLKNVRIYAPIGDSNDLLAYLMRRLLENGANSSFVHKVVDKKVPISELTANIYDEAINLVDSRKGIVLPENIYPKRKNAMGYDLGYKSDYDYIQDKVKSCFSHSYVASSIIGGRNVYNKKYAKDHFSPAKTAEKIATVSHATQLEIKETIDFAKGAFEKWSSTSIDTRAKILNTIADLYEKNKFKLYAILIQEAGKSIHDAINEVIEAIDFCRYYAVLAQSKLQNIKMPGPTGEDNILEYHGRGVFLCISPWNFPLAIFTGQIAAALVTGNTVIAKPADQTCVIANFAIYLMHQAGVPKPALQLLLASGQNISNYVINTGSVDGVAFTGSTATAQIINKNLAENSEKIAPLIAETGGQNAMIVDSSALLEQVTDDVLNSAFYSAGQRCSALRVLYIQEEIHDNLLQMIKEAMELLKIGDTADFTKDIGPVIDTASFDVLTAHVENMKKQGFKVTNHPRNASLKDGNYFYPHIIEINSINDIENEKFGPILHVIKYKAKEVDKVIEEINNYGFGLTFGIHSRIEKNIDYITSKVKVGNIYANRTIIGAKVESQPFGGEGKSGTGFKAGGPNYLIRFCNERVRSINLTAIGGNIELLKKSG